MTRGSGRGEAKVGAALDAVESGRGVGAFYRAAEGRGATGMQRGTAAIRCNFKASISEGGEMGWHQLQEGKRRRHRSDSIPMRRRWLEGSGYGSVKPTGGGSLQTGGGRQGDVGQLGQMGHIAWAHWVNQKGRSVAGSAQYGQRKGGGVHRGLGRKRFSAAQRK
jgi:hypothetical protein